MRIDERVVEGVTVLSIEGKLTSDEGNLLKDAVDALIRRGTTRLIFDFEGVPDFDSAGFADVIRAYATLGREGIKPRFRLNQRWRAYLDRMHIPPHYFLAPDD